MRYRVVGMQGSLVAESVDDAAGGQSIYLVVDFDPQFSNGDGRVIARVLDSAYAHEIVDSLNEEAA